MESAVRGVSGGSGVTGCCDQVFLQFNFQKV